MDVLLGLVLMLFVYGALPGILVGVIFGFFPRHIVDGLGFLVIPIVVVVAVAALGVGYSTPPVLMPVVSVLISPIGIGFVLGAVLGCKFIRFMTRPDATEQG